MVGQFRRNVVLATAVTLVLAACTGGGESTEVATTDPLEVAPTGAAEHDSAVETPGTADSTPVTAPRGTETVFTVDPDTGEVTESEVEIPGPGTFGEVVDFGIDAGLWDEIEGLTRVLGNALGAVPAEFVPGVEGIHTGELNEVLRRANALALSGDYNDDELSDLRRWYEIIVPSSEVVENLTGSAASPQASGVSSSAVRAAVTPPIAHREEGNSGVVTAVRAGSLVQAQGNCAPVVADEFDDWGVIEGCYEKYEDVVEGVTLSVLYPSWYNEDENLANLPLLAREALATSATTYKPLGEIGAMSVVFSLVDTVESGGTLAVATSHAQWGEASIPPGCPITLFPASFTGDGTFKQTVAHEAWHCVQHYSGFPAGVASGTAWFHEGGAEYFSNVAYPTVNHEHGWLPTFDGDSLRKPLNDLSYEAWVWWQFLANRESPRAVADLHLSLMRSGGGLSGLKGYGEEFQRFVVDYVAGKIPDASGADLPPGTRLRGKTKQVTKQDKGKTYTFEVEPFVAARFRIRYKRQLRVFESDDTSTKGELAMVESAKRFDPANWKEVFPEVRSECKEDADYLLVVTTEDGTHKAKIKIDRIEGASCDPCMLGTWDLDLETFAAMILDAAAKSGQGVPAGASLGFSGHYYTALEDKGEMKEQRDGLVMEMSIPEGELSLTIDSYAEGSYTADGENVAVAGVHEFYANVSSSIPGLGEFVFPQGSSFSDGGGGTYECRKDDMTLTVTGFLPLRYDRVDKILEPDPAALVP